MEKPQKQTTDQETRPSPQDVLQIQGREKTNTYLAPTTSVIKNYPTQGRIYGKTQPTLGLLHRNAPFISKIGNT